MCFIQLFTHFIPTCPSEAGCDTRSFFKQSTARLNSEFFFYWNGCFTKSTKTQSTCYLPLTGGRKNDSGLSQRALVQSKLVKLATFVEGDLKALFSIAITPRCRGGCYNL